MLRRLARLLLVLQGVLILTGGAVRITGSGLGCPTWPECTGESYLPVEGQIEGALHAWIEFGNRLLTFLLFATAVAVLILVIRSGRKELRLLALSQVGGIFGQAILGGITVLTKLNPLSVASHFLLSIILVAAAQSLLFRIQNPDAPSNHNAFIHIHTALTALVLVAGTLVTGAGPHAGDTTAPRLAIEIPLLATIHGLLVVLLIALTIFMYINARARRRGLSIFLFVALAQGVLGYAQYLLGVPELMVAAHLAGSTLTWISAWKIRLDNSRA
jgi:cytochrome c oxidase assembly protein subunit 15